MSTFSVLFFGHRIVDDLRFIDKKMFPLLKKLMKIQPSVQFFIGRNGEFDEYVASLIKRMKKEIEWDWYEKGSELTLVLPYAVANLEFYEKYYDSIIIAPSVHRAHPKSAITIKNRWMIEQSDLVIVYVKKMGGAYAAMKYAEKLNKKIINLFDEYSGEFTF